MHRPQSHAESPPPVRLWLRTHGRQALVLAVLYFVFGHASFLVQVDDVLVTPVLFAPEGIALAMALRLGAAVWPGVFAGQLVLALSSGLAPWPAVSIAAVNSLEVVLAVFLFRAFKLDATLPRARDLTGLLLLVFFVLQPFSATLGNAALWAGGIIDRAALPTSWLSWWIGNSFGQMLVAPLLLALFAGGRTKRQTAGDFLVPLLVILPAFWAADYLLRWAGVSSLVVVFAPILVLLAIYRGLVAVCVGGFLIALGALYATSHAFGPFVSGGRADIPSLNLFIIGLTLSGQFLAMFLRQLGNQRKLEDELQASHHAVQRAAYELTENIPVGTYVLEFDAEGNPGFTFVSERWLKMLDLRRADVLADHALAVSAVHPDEREAFDRLNAEVHTERKRFFWEGRIVVHGETRWVTIESVPRSRPGGGTIWEGAMIDITDRKAAEERIARSEVALRNALDTLPFAVGMCGASPSHADPEAQITFLNRNFIAAYGYDQCEIPTAAAWATKAYPDENYRSEVFLWWDTAVRRLMTGGSIVETHESRAVTKDGKPVDIMVSATMLEEKLIVSFLDISERKRAERQLQRVLDNLPIAVAATTLTSPADITFINKQFTRAFGYTLEDVPTVAAWAEKAYPDPDYRREVFHNWDQAVFRAIKTRGSVESMEFEVTCQDGTKRDIIFRAVVMDDRLLTTMTDVTALKIAERQVRSLREEIERAAFELTENIPVGTYTMVQPTDGGMAYFSFMSTRFLELTGLERAAAEADPMNAFACVHPDDHAEWVRKNAYVFEHKLPFKEECRVVVDGQIHWIIAESTPRDMPDGSVVWEGVLTDITARRLAEAALRQVTQRMQLAAAAAGIGFWSRDRESRIEEWDDQMFRIYGVSREDFDGRWEPLVHPDDLPVVELLTEEALTAGHTGEYEYRIVRPDGTVRHIRGMSVCASGPQGELSHEIGVNFDITEEREAATREKEFDLRYRRELESKLKTSLTASAVAHEINQPLSTILLQSKMALESGTGTRDILQSIAAEAQRVVVTIDKMKTLLRNVQTDHRQIDLAVVVQSTLLYNKGLLARHNIRVLRTGLKKPCRIMGDDAQLQLALTNLLRNAVEAIEESQPEKREIAVAIKAGTETVELIVGDSGPGWSGAPIVETPLHTTKKGGTGIGLYVVRTAMENHHGEITFERSALGGAEVRLKFPRVEEKA